jgi:hypothetical protein
MYHDPAKCQGGEEVNRHPTSLFPFECPGVTFRVGHPALDKRMPGLRGSGTLPAGPQEPSSGPLAGGLCTIVQATFGEYPFHALR